MNKTNFPKTHHFRSKLSICLIMLIFVWPCLAAAEPKGEMEFDLNELIEQLKDKNPQLIQARQNYLAAKAVIPQATAFNPLQIGLIQNPIPGSPLNIGNSQGFSYTLTQSFSFPGKKRLAGEIAQDQAEFTKTQTDSLFLQLLAQLKATFYQLIVLQHQVELNKENIQRLEQIKQITKVRYANNAAAYADFLNAQVAQSSAENDQFALQRQIDTTRQTLNTLIGRDPSTPLKIQGTLPGQKLPKKPLIELEDVAVTNNPAAKGATLQVAAAGKSVDLAKKGYWPDFQVILTNISDNPPWGISSSNYGVEFDMVLPTWFFTKEKAGLEQANATLRANEANDLSIRQQIRLTVDSAYNALAQAVNQSDFIRSRQLEEARLAYRLGLANYANGGTAFIDLITAQTNLRNTELALIQSENSAVQAFTNLAAVVGTEVE